ncbi:MAG: sucA, partial [Acidimicrobiia bacterium]|nr:sucA [Acidimicrobiia bacterium]
MYEDFLADPASVSESWREFFADYKAASPAATNGSTNGTAAPAVVAAAAPVAAATAATPTAVAAAPAVTASPATDGVADGKVISGPAKAIAENMIKSLGVPTATSFREVPAKLLEVNRNIVNNYLRRIRGGKVSFTHLIGYAVVRAIADDQPVMNSSYVAAEASSDGKARVVRNERVNLGLAVDVTKADGSHTLVVPVLKNADTYDFNGFVDAYDELIRKVKTNKLGIDDYQGATVSLTNPGTVGTMQSVPRLMPGQGLIVGVGTIDFPAEYAAADPESLAEIGVSKIVTISSTYDHRIIQGAESGLFLKAVQERLLGEHGFWEHVFKSLGVPYEAVKWRRDVHPVDRTDGMLRKQMSVSTLMRTHRVRGHLIADLDPLRQHEPEMPPELDPATYGLTLWDLDREFLTGTVSKHDRLPLGEILSILRDAYCRTIGVEYIHITDSEQQQWIQER